MQDNHSRSRRGTLRGIHFQTHPGQGKLVRVARGRVLDVVGVLSRSGSEVAVEPAWTRTAGWGAGQGRLAELLAEGGYTAEKVQCVDMFCWTGAVETVMSLVQQNPDDIVKVGIDADELAVTKAESKATYGEIQARVKEQTGLNVTPLYIAQVKQKYGIIERECYNKPKSEDAKQPQCPPDKEAAIVEALKFYGLIAP